MNLSRRDILKLGVSAAALWAARAKGLAMQAEPRKKIPVGLQLYSVREDCGKDLPGVLTAVGKMGYEGVEFAGYYGRKAEELRKLLDDNGLKCCGTHTGLDTLTGDNLKATAEFNRTLGNKFLIVPSLPPTHTASVQALKDTAKLFGELAEKARPLGMRVGYHAHAGDLRPVEEQVPWDVIFGNTGPEVVMQLDTSNCLDGGADPLAVLKRYPGRSVTIHLKEHGGKPGAVIGEGEVAWKDILRFCEKEGGTEWYIVEQERYAGAPIDSVKQCLVNLRKMLA